MIALLLALQIVTADPCLQGAGGDQTQSDVVDGGVTIGFCWSGTALPTTTFIILLDGKAVFTGPLIPVLKAPSGPSYYEWTPAPPVILDGAHTITITVTSAGSTATSSQRPILKRPPQIPAPFNVRAKGTP